MALYLCSVSTENSFVLFMLEKFSWDADPLTLDRRLAKVAKRYPDFRETDLFPANAWISSDLDSSVFIRSVLIQPRVWIRVRSGHEEVVRQELRERGILHEEDADRSDAWSFEPSVSLDNLNTFHSGYFEFQDRSSQLVGDYFGDAVGEWWDVCAASGGKSLMLLDRFAEISLTATDIRESILVNLRERFQRAGHTAFEAFPWDVSEKTIPEKRFDGIIADVPCTGSGTWGRTPEMMSSFTGEAEILRMVETQRRILENCFPALLPGGRFVYVTCSVFRQENEEQVQFITAKTGWKPDFQGYLTGYSHQADTLFVATFINH